MLNPNATSILDAGAGTLLEVEPNSILAVFSAVMSNILLFFLIFGLSATVNLKDLQHQLTNKFAIGTGVAMQFVLMPLLGFVTVCIFSKQGFSTAMGISLLVVTASPGGSYSNWWCSLFNAELALSVAMTSVSSLLSIGLLPANLLLYGWLAFGVVLGNESINIVASLDFGAIFITLGVVLGAILSGLWIGYRYDKPVLHSRANHFGSICGIVLILFSVFLGSGAGGADTNIWSLPWSFYVGTAFPCIVGMSLANIAARSFHLTPPEVVAISIECCYQNTAIATSVAVTMFSDPNERAEAVSVPLLYGVVEAVIIGIYCVWAWKMGWTKAPKDEKLCVVMTKTYEVHGAHPEQECDDEEHHQEVVAHTNCCKRMFVPRYPDAISDMETGALGVNDDNKKEKRDESFRTRLHSADVTVCTNCSSPPPTPDPFSNVSLNDDPAGARDRLNSDLDPPSVKGKIPAICEGVEENEDTCSDESNTFMLPNPSQKVTLNSVSRVHLKGAIPTPVDDNESSATDVEDEAVVHC
ncbi:bile acid:sodium symporter [Nitzschia inconspicua]|uniref:Bile acid:sodium symporter n=1 Tax=Nitzschia inconspicua TaxID=303405 RepID=A0A9K3LZD7_9STRA|nr:bile acid:sodium symporter [Nitzschia inconspicua]